MIAFLKKKRLRFFYNLKKKLDGLSCDKYQLHVNTCTKYAVCHLPFQPCTDNASQLVGITQSKATFQVKSKFESLFNKVTCVHSFLQVSLCSAKGHWLIYRWQLRISLFCSVYIQRTLKNTTIRGSNTKRQVSLHMYMHELRFCV